MASASPPTAALVRVRVPAKINLALRVGAPRADGYHPLATVYQAVSLYDDATSRGRGDAVRAGEGTRSRLQSLAHELGLVTRDEWDELELRIAQLEHRLRLLEDREP